MAFRKSVLMAVVLVFCLGEMLLAAETPIPETAAVPTYSLIDLYRIALEHAETIQLAENELYYTEKDKDRAFSYLVPKVSAFGNYTRYSEAKVLQPESAHGYGVRLDQSFTLNGRELIGYRVAKDNITKSRYDLEAAKESYLLQVTAAYYDVLKSEKRIAISESNVARLQDHRDAVMIRIKMDEVPKTELFRTEAELSGAKTDLLISQNNLRVDKAALARLVAISPSFELEMHEFVETPFDQMKLKELTDCAFSDRAELKSLKIAQSISTSMVDITKGAYWPTLAIEGVYQGVDSDPSSYLPDKDSLYIGFNLNFLLYDWGNRAAEVSQARFREKQAELRLSDNTRQVAVEVERAYSNLLTAKSAIDALGDALESASANYAARVQMFENGLTDSLNVADANTLMLESEIKLLEARYSYGLAITALERAKGSFLRKVMDDIRDGEKKITK